MSRYELTTRVQKEYPESAAKINGTGLLNMISDSLNKMSSVNNYVYNDSPFSLLEKEDFDGNDNIVKSFFNKVNNVESVFASKNNKEVVADIYLNLFNIRAADIRSEIRKAYNNIQNALDKNNDAVKLERIASKMSVKSSGHYQIEALKTVDNLLKLSLTDFANIKFSNVREHLLTGNKDNYKTAARLLKDSFDELMPKENRRLAYTSLSTQNNEPFLLCPKGKLNGSNNSGAVPMEISKCRDNCIDSRVDPDGRVSCNYKAWLTAAFESHDQVMARLDTTKHPDNEANLINIEEGKRKRHDDEYGYESRFEKSDVGVNKMIGKSENDLSREYQLRNRKAPYSNYENDKEIENTPVEQQLPHKIDKGIVKKASVLDYILRSDEDDNYETFRSKYLHKTAKLVEDKDDSITRETELEDRRKNEKIDKNIQALLDGSEVEFSHQFSDDDMKQFASELGLDHTLEDKREN